jgi:hypothetical protein
MFQAEHTTTAPFLAGAWRRAQPGPIVGPRHARPETGAARGCGPAASGEFDRACARCRRNGRSGRRNRCFDQTKEHGLASLPVCRVGHSLDTVTRPTAGGIENASHTEILTLPTLPQNQTLTPRARCSERLRSDLETAVEAMLDRVWQPLFTSAFSACCDDSLAKSVTLAGAWSLSSS